MSLVFPKKVLYYTLTESYQTGFVCLVAVVKWYDNRRLYFNSMCEFKRCTGLSL